ncbi:hypothetical protein N752_31240 [Desulforamulus aquiferis]|nr:PAS domain-containing protein [Desulforamulus aquiferis]RYD01239.1 hypothetical protein N752_31240 [Desulforamulus aquiferis]
MIGAGSMEKESKINCSIASIVDCIFNSLKEYVYISDPYTYEIIYANQALNQLYGKDLVGGICYKQLQSLDKPCVFCTNDKILGNGYKPYQWEHHNSQLNRDFIVIDRIITWTDGRDVRFEMALDITESKKSARAIARRLEFVEMVKRLSSRFIGTISFDQAINDSLADIGMLCDAHRAYLFSINYDQGVMNNTHEWCAEGVTPQIERLQSLPLPLFPWWIAKLKLGEVILINDIDELPEEASKEKEILKSQDIKSALVLPVFMSNQLTCFIGFDNVKDTDSWTEDDLTHLRVVAEIISNVMERDKALEDLTRYKILAERTREIIFFIGMDGKIIEANKSASQFYGYSRRELLGKSFHDLTKKSKEAETNPQRPPYHLKGWL